MLTSRPRSLIRSSEVHTQRLARQRYQRVGFRSDLRNELKSATDLSQQVHFDVVVFGTQ